MLEGLPGHVLDLMRSSSIAGFATISAAGMPIDTPVLYFPGEGLRSLDLATGLSYPAKAERARKNPKVGMLLEGGPQEPVISIAGMASVRDADLQANVHRYVAAACHALPHNPEWSLARQAVWYWTRIIIEVTPARISWWNSRAEMEFPPQNWQASDDTTYPMSDPAPPGRTSAPAQWEETSWQELAARAVARNAGGHLSLIDAEGFPRPIRANAITATETGFAVELPRGIPWAIAGKACLTFGGLETFLGEASGSSGSALLHVERALPLFPMTNDVTQLWEPSPDTREQLMRRLLQETQRRGQPIPTIPLDKPPPSEGHKRRMARMKAAS